MASAADIRQYFQSNCVGGYVEFANVASGHCCTTSFPSATPTSGFPSLAVLNADFGTQLFGYQRTRNGDDCGAIAAQQATGVMIPEMIVGLDLDPIIGRFAASRWYPARPVEKRYARACAPTITEKCESAVMPNRVVLDDGDLFELEGLDEETNRELIAFALNGATVGEVPDRFAEFKRNRVKGEP
ncbi:hypothetical protein GQ43DRAFT_472929 [Delitschia confertaspora ATCC 74209]|uniref:Uncharacterized protein n=1 Tax=Delitschia confertaspora ATCC 74209 TaxID=1513339 RepID=A0A9P4JNQ5_9PLEO|nr:hypothetical protein GQ43DRAFT_472929 [Delitschia confertaspora ATCC 74209]